MYVVGAALSNQAKAFKLHVLCMQVRMFIPVTIASAFLNNTPIVALLIPCVSGCLARCLHNCCHQPAVTLAIAVLAVAVNVLRTAAQHIILPRMMLPFAPCLQHHHRLVAACWCQPQEAAHPIVIWCRLWRNLHSRRNIHKPRHLK
jgi:hypothetical protein